MIKPSLTRLAVAVGSLALSLAAGAGIASADPDLDPIVNTTCSYQQAESALKAANPEAAAAFNASPPTQSALRNFLASSPSGRLQMAQQLQSSPAGQPYVALIQQIAATCNNY
ncbi:MAG: hemophore-related protein [Mycobacterium sp.]